MLKKTKFFVGGGIFVLGEVKNVLSTFYIYNKFERFFPLHQFFSSIFFSTSGLKARNRNKKVCDYDYHLCSTAARTLKRLDQFLSSG